MSGIRTSGSFIDGARGRILLLMREPVGPARGCVLVVPPFAEEMNKCRRMITEATLALAALGVVSVVPDVYGTGDSEGDFADADWNAWVDDLSLTASWCRSRAMPVSALLALRLGSALASEAIRTGAIDGVGQTVLWQPVFDGRRFMVQFMRQRIAVTQLQYDKAETMVDIRSRLAAGEIVDVAGYGITEKLVDAIDNLVAPTAHVGGFGRTAWMELVRDAGRELSAPSAALVRGLREHGGAIEVMTFTGEPYWAATEITVNSAVVAATVRILAGPEVPAGPGGTWQQALQ